MQNIFCYYEKNQNYQLANKIFIFFNFSLKFQCFCGDTLSSQLSVLQNLIPAVNRQPWLPPGSWWSCFSKSLNIIWKYWYPKINFCDKRMFVTKIQNIIKCIEFKIQNYHSCTSILARDLHKHCASQETKYFILKNFHFFQKFSSKSRDALFLVWI